MVRGKQTCKILKDIRRQIAEANDIEYITSECQYKGDCTGTCPKCEAEVQYLEQQLALSRTGGYSARYYHIWHKSVRCTGYNARISRGHDRTDEIHKQKIRSETPRLSR